MITEICLENFKRFRDLSLQAANLTVLTGANGAGKTSVLHSLLLARQMSMQPEKSYVELNGVDTLELGGPEDVIHHEASDDLAAVEVLDTLVLRHTQIYGYLRCFLAPGLRCASLCGACHTASSRLARNQKSLAAKLAYLDVTEH